MFHDLKLQQPTLRELASSGLLLGGLTHTLRLMAGSKLEGPTSIQSVVASGAFLDVGAFCNLSGGHINNIRAGRYCSIADGVSIGTHAHPVDWLTTSRTAYFPQVHGWDQLMLDKCAMTIEGRAKPPSNTCPVTTLGPDVWVGQGAFLKSGVTIGAGAVIGARATVVKDVPPYAIVVGTPGRVVRLRFPESLVERLLASEWWQYSVYDLLNAPLDDPERALDMIEERVLSGRLRPFVGMIFEPSDLADPQTVATRIMETARRHAAGQVCEPGRGER